MTGPVRLTSGTVDAPGLTFNGFNGAGFYRIGANRLGIAVSSVTAGEINASATAVWDIYTAFASVASIASVIGVSGGVQTTVTITGGLIVTGGMVVGFSATPTADTIQISDAGIKLNNAPPYMGSIINSTDDDGIYYKRDDDFFELWTGDEDTFSAETDRVFFNNGPILLNEVSTPASASSDEVTLFVKDNDGKTRPCYIDQNGVVTFMGGPLFNFIPTSYICIVSTVGVPLNPTTIPPVTIRPPVIVTVVCTPPDTPITLAIEATEANAVYMSHIAVALAFISPAVTLATAIPNLLAPIR